MIPDEAMDAALKAIGHLPTVTNESRRKTVQAILEAAAPHIMEPAVSSLEKLAASWDDESTYCEPGDQIAQGKGIAADELREVIAALKGDAK